MRKRFVVALVAALMAVGTVTAVAAGTSVPVACSITDNTLSCPLPAPVKTTVTKTVTKTKTVTAQPTTAPSSSVQSPTPTPSSTAPASSTAATTTSAPPTAVGFPDATNTGVAQCGPLTKVETGGQVVLNEDGQVYENKELTDETIIRVRANNVTIRCVKMNGTGWFGIDNTEIAVTNTFVDQVEISCLDNPQRIGVLLRNGTLSRANVHNCDHMVNAGGDQLTVKDSYCHDLTDKEVVHADCIQTLGGATGLLIERNALYSRDTSDIMLGQEFGDAKDIVIRGNLFGASGSPHPAYLLYLSGTNTVVENNRFTRDYTYGHCTLNTTNPVTWTGNVWHDTGEPIAGC